MSSESDLKFPGETSINDHHTASSAETQYQIPNVQYDFISILAIAQKLNIDFLPITWDPRQEVISIGETSLAFKRIREKDNPKSEPIFQEFIHEMIVLSHSAIRQHPNIIDLQGICWEISSDHKVWPVLVLEKSTFGNLYDFLRLPTGRDLSMNDRLGLCLNIIMAIVDMHSICKK